MSDDDVVQDLNAENLAGLAEPAGDVLVIARRFGVPGRMVVGDDDCSGSVEHRVAEHLARRYERVVDRPDGHGRGRDESVLDVEVEGYGVLAVKILQQRDTRAWFTS